MAVVVDPKKYPRLASYLEHLPQGLESHPACETRGSVPRAMLEERPVGELPPGDLPAPLHALLLAPPLRTAWIPEAHGSALTHLIADVHRLQEPDYLQFVEKVTLRINGSMFTMLMSIISPQMLLSAASSRWSTTHRGSTLTAERSGSNGTRLVLGFPDALFSELGLKLWANVFRVTLEHSRAKGAEVVVAEASRTRGVYECSWQ
ncbi:MAG TPA: hypothetical protein VGK67_29430 [Myxococcales bacterium]|jgi:hypothetical protein